MRPDNGPAMNTMAMRDFDSPRDNRYGEADIVRVNVLYVTEFSWRHTIRHFYGPQCLETYETNGQCWEFDPFWTKNCSVVEGCCASIVARFQRNEGWAGHASRRSWDTMR